MHFLEVVTVCVLLPLVGAEFSVSAFVNPSAWQLEQGAQARMLGRLAQLLGKVMPVWYAAGMILLAVESWTYWHRSDFYVVLAATLLWLAATLGSILFLVPLNNRVIAGGAGWQEAHRSWDRRHRVRIAVLAAASILFASVAVR